VHTLDLILAESAKRHKHLCPRQVLGARMGLFAAELLGIELPRRDKRLLVISETEMAVLWMDSSQQPDVALEAARFASKTLVRLPLPLQIPTLKRRSVLFRGGMHGLLPLIMHEARQISGKPCC